MTNPLNPLYDAVAWVMQQIHTGLSTFMSPVSGLAWVLTIVILVVLMRLILVPLFVKQMHASRCPARPWSPGSSSCSPSSSASPPPS